MSIKIILLTFQISKVYTTSSGVNMKITKNSPYVTVSRSARQNFAVTTVSSTAIPPITPDDNYKNNLNYGRVSAGCPNSHPDFDQNLGNTCSNQNVMGSVCSVGVGQEHFKIWLEYIFRFIL